GGAASHPRDAARAAAPRGGDRRPVHDQPTRRQPAPAGAPGKRTGPRHTHRPPTRLRARRVTVPRPDRLAQPVHPGRRLGASPRRTGDRGLSPPSRAAPARHDGSTTGEHRMTNPPTGRLVPTVDGNELVVSRTFRAPIEDVWASVTEPDRTARWFGTWKGDAAPGRMIKVQMGFEDQAPWLDKRIDACDPPRRLALSNESGNMRIELLLSYTDGLTELQLVHHLDPTDEIGGYGPGWEYYLDMLAAARDDLPTPSFDDYYPAMKPYYEALPTQTNPA